MSNLTSDQIVALNELRELEVGADLYRCAPPEFAQEFRLKAIYIGSVWVGMILEFDLIVLNRIVGLGVGHVATESMLDDAMASLQKAGCKNYMAQVSPLAKPARLPEWLDARGFTRTNNVAKMYRGNKPASFTPTPLRLQAIGQEQAEAFAEIATTVHGMPLALGPLFSGNIGKPGWHHYLAFDGEQPVSAAAMFVSGEVGWLGFGSTLDSHRKRGGQSAMFARRINDGLALGCKWFVTETAEDTPEQPNASYHNMLRSGFELAYLRPNYLYQPPDN